MPEPIYGLTARTKDRVVQLIQDGGATGGRVTSGAPARGVTWVLVTDDAGDDGWYPAVVTLTVEASWQDLVVEVLIRASDDSELHAGVRYLATRTGDSPSGLARFRTPGPNPTSPPPPPTIIPITCPPEDDPSCCDTYILWPDTSTVYNCEGIPNGPVGAGCGDGGGGYEIRCPEPGKIFFGGECLTCAEIMDLTGGDERACDTPAVPPTVCLTIGAGTGSFELVDYSATLTLAPDLSIPISYHPGTPHISIDGQLKVCPDADPPGWYFVGTATTRELGGSSPFACGCQVSFPLCPGPGGDGVQSIETGPSWTAPSETLVVETPCGGFTIDFGPCPPPPPPPPPPPSCCDGPGEALEDHPDWHVVRDGVTYTATWSATDHFYIIADPIEGSQVTFTCNPETGAWGITHLGTTTAATEQDCSPFGLTFPASSIPFTSDPITVSVPP